MTKSGEPPDRYCGAPEPPSDTAAEGMAWAKQLAQRYLPNDVRLCAIIAFGENNASLWTRLQAARLIAQIAGAIPETIPDAAQPDGDGSAHA